MGSWIGTIIFGIVVGALARLALPGKQQLAVWMHIVIGVVGALIGGAIWNALGGGDTSGIDWIMLIISVATAAALILIVEQVRAKQ